MFRAATSYLVINLFTGLADWVIRFLFFWLVEGPKSYWKRAFALFLAFEDIWAVGITAKNFFTPLYQDYSIAGRIIGPFFRLGRILIGLGVLAIIFAGEAAFFLFLCLVFWGSPFFFIINLFIWNQ